MNKVEEIEKRIRDQLLVNSGFAYSEVLARKLELKLKAYDSQNTGSLNFKEFFAAMTKLNFVAMTKDIEMLFNRYDEDGTGLIDYKLFSSCVCQFLSIGIYDTRERGLLNRLLNELVRSQGIDSMYCLKKSIRTVCGGTDEAVTCENFIDGVVAFDIYIADRELEAIYNCIHRASQQLTPSLLFVMNAVRNGHEFMTFERKAFLRQTFYSVVEVVNEMYGENRRSRYDPSPNALTLGQLLERFDANAHPSVRSGMLTPAQCIGQMVDLFDIGIVNKSSYSNDGLEERDLQTVVTYESFLSYYKGVSIAIRSSTEFNELVRSSWKVTPNSRNDGIDPMEHGYSMPEQLVVDEPVAMSSNFYGVSNEQKKSYHRSKRIDGPVSPPGPSFKSSLNPATKSKLRSYETIMERIASPSASQAELRRLTQSQGGNRLKGTVKYFYGNDSLKAEQERETLRQQQGSGKPYTRRVILVDSNGGESVVDFILAPDGSGEPVYRVPDKREMMLQLRREGYTDVVDIRM